MNPNFSDGLLVRSELKEAVRELFSDDSEVALFYFAGHGYIETTGGYLCAGDCKTGDDGLALSEVMTLANESKARNKIIMLDSCYSGALGDHPINRNVSEISEGMTILTASSRDRGLKQSQHADQQEADCTHSAILF
jgi:uncharacterized caspase-like protein